MDSLMYFTGLAIWIFLISMPLFDSIKIGKKEIKMKTSIKTSYEKKPVFIHYSEAGLLSTSDGEHYIYYSVPEIKELKEFLNQLELPE